jgi:Tol biopolymer transport system component
VYDFPPKEDSPDRDIFVLATNGSRETPLVEHPGNDFVLGWAPDGKRILFASDRTGVLSAWVIAVADGRPQGAPELVKSDIGRIVSYS